MTFRRTSSGINNYRKFFSTEIIIFIEGKTNKNRCFDREYYETIFTKHIKIERLKIKPVGNKKDVLGYFDDIKEKNLQNTLALVDKDLDGIIRNPIPDHRLIQTYGYSWENEFWNINTINKVSEAIMLDHDEHINRAIKNRTLKKIKLISALDNACQLHNCALIKKNNASAGISFQLNKNSLITTNELGRHIRNYRMKKIQMCQTTKDIINISLRLPAEAIVQGHIWEHMSITLLSDLYKKAYGNSTLPRESIKNIAFTQFKRASIDIIPKEIIQHYTTLIQRALTPPT